MSEAENADRILAGLKEVAESVEVRSSGDWPAFEVLTPSGQTYRIWSNGRVEGFGDKAIIINRIPAEINRAVARAIG